MVLTIDSLHDALEQCGDVRKYSGRGMYGKQCLGIVTDGQGEFQLLADIIHALDVPVDASEVVRRDGVALSG
jgi:hypothetical protein